MTTVLIRADASLSIGSGHVIRCRTLARELKCRGAYVVFLCRRLPGDLIALLEREFPVLSLPELPPPASKSSGDVLQQGMRLYDSWLGCSQDQDSADCLQALAKVAIHRARGVVGDHYGLDAHWDRQLLEGLSVEQAPVCL